MEQEWMIVVSDLNKTIDGEKILRNLSFSFTKKGIHGILGPERSGKTALLEILAGMDPDFQGLVQIGGRLLGSDPIAWKKKLGYVPKESALDPDMTVEEILDLVGRVRGVPAEKRYRQIKEAMELMGLSDVKKRLIGRMTKAPRKKLELAAALLGNPDVLLLDSPERGLLSSEREELFGLIRMLGTMKTVVLATDRYESAESLCEDIVLVADGQALASGSFADLEEKLNRNTDGKVLSLKEIYGTLSAPFAAEDGTKEDEE